MKLGKSLYGKKWHILKENGQPLCGYMSFSWAIEHEEIETESLKGYELCRGCLLKIKGKAKGRKKQKSF